MSTRERWFRWMVGLAVAFLILYWMPWLVVRAQYASSIVSSVDELSSDATVVVLGTLVNDSGDISPLLQERLDTAYTLWEAGRAERVVVSNTATAASVMEDALVDRGMPRSIIELDASAETMLDTCHALREQSGDVVTFVVVSQQFHLSRTLYQCKQVGVEAVGVPADRIAPAETSTDLSVLDRARIRFTRHLREAGLTWLVWMRIYS